MHFLSPDFSHFMTCIAFLIILLLLFINHHYWREYYFYFCSFYHFALLEIFYLMYLTSWVLSTWKSFIIVLQMNLLNLQNYIYSFKTCSVAHILFFYSLSLLWFKDAPPGFSILWSFWQRIGMAFVSSNCGRFGPHTWTRNHP